MWMFHVLVSLCKYTWCKSRSFFSISFTASCLSWISSSVASTCNHDWHLLLKRERKNQGVCIFSKLQLPKPNTPVLCPYLALPSGIFARCFQFLSGCLLSKEVIEFCPIIITINNHIHYSSSSNRGFRLTSSSGLVPVTVQSQNHNTKSKLRMELWCWEPKVLESINLWGFFFPILREFAG